MSKSIKTIRNITYGIGVLIVASLVGIVLFGPGKITNPDAMIPLTWKELAFVWLSIGTIPMLLACMAVYKFNEVKSKNHKKRYSFIIFLPAIICGGCALYVIGLLIAGMVNSFLLN